MHRTPHSSPPSPHQHHRRAQTQTQTGIAAMIAAAGVLAVAAPALAQVVPGQADPLGIRPDNPVLRDDELLIFGRSGANSIDASLYNRDTTTVPGAVTNRMITRGGTSNMVTVAAATGRILGVPVDQAVVVRKPASGSGPFFLDIVDLYGEGEEIVRGRYTFTPFNPNSEVSIAVGDMDNLISHDPSGNPALDRKCAEIVLIYEGVGFANKRRVKTDVISFRNITSLDVPINPPAPIVIGSHFLYQDIVPDCCATPVDQSLLAHPTLDDPIPNFMKVRIVDPPLYTNNGGGVAGRILIVRPATDGRMLMTLHEYFNNFGVDDGFINHEQFTNPSAERSRVILSQEAIDTGGWDVLVGNFGYQNGGFDGESQNLRVSLLTRMGTNGSELFRRSYWWSDQNNPNTFAANPATTAPIHNNAGINLAIRRNSPIRASVIPQNFLNYPQSTYDGYTVMADTTRGMVVQTYTSGGGGPLQVSSPTWPTLAELTARPVVPQSIPSNTKGNVVAGRVFYDRSSPDLTAQQYPAAFIATDADQLIRARYRPLAGGSYYEAPEVLAINNLGPDDPNGNPTFTPASIPNMTVMALGDVDGDSAYFSYTGPGPVTYYLGTGTRFDFTGMVTPTLMLQEPPKHADYIRNTVNPAAGTVVNISRTHGMNVEYRGELETAVENTNQTKVGHSFGQKLRNTTTVESSITAPSVNASLSVNVALAIDSQTSMMETQLFGSGTTTTTGTTHFADDDDALIRVNKNLYLWRYPVLGLVTQPGGDVLTNPYLDLTIPAPDTGALPSGGRNFPEYQPRHINGNVLSYPEYTDLETFMDVLEAEYGTFRYANTDRGLAGISIPDGYNVNQNYSNFFQVVHNGMSSQNFESDSTLTTSLDISVKAHVDTSFGLFPGLSASVGVTNETDIGLTGTESFSTSKTKTTRSSSTNRLVFNTIPLDGTPGSYNVYPAFFFEKTGAVKSTFQVSLPTGTGSFWQANYNGPDAAISLPWRINLNEADDYAPDNCTLNTDTMRGQMKGVFATTIFNQARFDSAPAGDVLQLQARVYNLSVGTPISNLLVAFYAVEVDQQGTERGPRTFVGTSTVPTLAPRENTLTTLGDVLWDTSTYGPCVGNPERQYRIIVILDPLDDLRNETHEWLDRDENPLILINNNGLALDSGFGADSARPLGDPSPNAQRFLEKGQNNEGWFDFSITTGIEPLACTAPAADVSLASTSLQILANGAFQSTGADIAAGGSITVRIVLNSSVAAYDDRIVGLYDGEPDAAGTNLLQQIPVGNLSAGTTNIDFTWTPSISFTGSHTLHARVSQLPGDPVPSNNYDSIPVNGFTIAPTMYVDANAAVGGNGLSWNTAYRTLDAVLGLAGQTATPMIVRVADGLYRPTTLTNPNDARSATFNILNNVVLEGGYAGRNSADPDARDPAIYRTILTGDRLINDQPNFQNRGDNLYHVVTVGPYAGESLVDGIFIQAGNASGAINDGFGSAAWITGGDTQFNRCVVTDNTGNLGTVHVSGGIATFTLCDFGHTLGISTYNRATGGAGGAMLAAGGTVVADRCSFTYNTASAGGAVMATNTASVWISNSLIASNTASTAIGGGACLVMGGSLTLTNCTVVDNSAMANFGGALTRIAGSAALSNCIVWGNSPLASQINGVAAISYSDIQDGFAGTGNINADPFFVDAVAGNYQLSAGSPVVDAGNNSALSSDLTLDLAGLTRLRDDTGTIDTGLCSPNPDPFSGSALDFNGVDSAVVIPYLTPSSLINSFTLEAWVKPAGFDAPDFANRIISNRNGGTGFGFGEFGNGRLIFTAFGVLDYITTGTYLHIGEWTHVAVVFDASNDVNFYVNGELVETIAGTLPANPATTGLTIGRNPSIIDPQFWDGLIDDVRIWNVQRTASQLRSSLFSLIPTSTPGLVAAYRFDEGAGTIAGDISGGGHDGTLQGGIAWTDTQSNGCLVIDIGAFEFQGSTPPTCPPDWNHDNNLNSQDFFDFLASFFSNNGDYNHDNMTTSQDFFDFIAAFFTGC